MGRARIGCQADRQAGRWMDGQGGWHANKQIFPFTYGWMDGWMDGWTDRRMDGWMDGQTDGWMDGQTDGWIDG